MKIIFKDSPTDIEFERGEDEDDREFKRAVVVFDMNQLITLYLTDTEGNVAPMDVLYGELTTRNALGPDNFQPDSIGLKVIDAEEEIRRLREVEVDHQRNRRILEKALWLAVGSHEPNPTQTADRIISLKGLAEEDIVKEDSIECPACSKAGGADIPVHHLPPVCLEKGTES